MRASELSSTHRRRPSRGASTLLLAAALWPAAWTSPLGAQIVPIGGNIAINGTSGVNEEYPYVAADRQGGWVVSWSYLWSETIGAMRRLDRNGEFVASTRREHELEFADVGLDGEGNGVVVGTRARPELGGNEIDALCVDRLGRARAERVRVDAGNISSGTRLPIWPRVAVDTDGAFAVVWQEFPRDGATPSSIFFRRFDADCQALGNVESLGSVGVVRRSEAHIARTGDGGFVLVWLEGEGEAIRLKAQLFDRGGAPIAPSFPVTAGFLRPTAEPSIAVSASGSFAIVWISRSWWGTERDSLRARVFSRDAQPLGSEVELRRPQFGEPRSCSVAALESGFVAAWGEGGPYVSERSVYVRAFDAFAPTGGEVLVHASPTDPSGKVRIAALSATEFVVVWDDWSWGQDSEEVVARRFVLRPLETGCAESPAELCLGGDRFRVTVEWRDFLGNRGAGRTRSLTDDSGLFWFFDDTNLEVLVKMVDGCAEFSRHWFFAAATTNVEYTLRVTDTETGRSRSYFNRQGVSSPAITDTDAFATCP